MQEAEPQDVYYVYKVLQEFMFAPAPSSFYSCPHWMGTFFSWEKVWMHRRRALKWLTYTHTHRVSILYKYAFKFTPRITLVSSPGCNSLNNERGAALVLSDCCVCSIIKFCCLSGATGQGNTAGLSGESRAVKIELEAPGTCNQQNRETLRHQRNE